MHPVSRFGFAPNVLSPGERRRNRRPGDDPNGHPDPSFKESRITGRNWKGGSAWRAQAASSLTVLDYSAAVRSGRAARSRVNPPHPRCHQRGHTPSHGKRITREYYRHLVYSPMKPVSTDSKTSLFPEMVYFCFQEGRDPEGKKVTTSPSTEYGIGGSFQTSG